MAKSTIFYYSFLVFTFYMAKVYSARTQNPNQSKWAKTKHYGHEHKTVLQFYFHDIMSGDSPTVTLIAQPIRASPTALGFGSLFMADDPLTISPNPKSKLVGRAQGFYGKASQEEASLIMGLTYSFVVGVYNGSSVVILGRNSVMIPGREFPVVGGTGLFRMARGYAVAYNYFIDTISRSAIVGYNVTIFHS